MIKNFVQYAMRHYDKPQCTTVEEFNNDLNKFTFVNKLFHRHYLKGDLNARLLLNHLVILYNMFESKACTEMLFYKSKKEYWSGLKTMLTYLNYMPSYIDSVNINDSDILFDQTIMEELRQL